MCRAREAGGGALALMARSLYITWDGRMRAEPLRVHSGMGGRGASIGWAVALQLATDGIYGEGERGNGVYTVGFGPPSFARSFATMTRAAATAQYPPTTPSPPSPAIAPSTAAAPACRITERDIPPTIRFRAPKHKTLPIRTKPYIWESGLVRQGRQNPAAITVVQTFLRHTTSVQQGRPLIWCRPAAFGSARSAASWYSRRSPPPRGRGFGHGADLATRSGGGAGSGRRRWRRCV